MAVVTPHIETHLKANMNLKKRDIIVSNFLGGLSWGLGSAIGATIIVAILLKALSIIPGVSDFTKQIIHPVTNQTQQLK